MTLQEYLEERYRKNIDTIATVYHNEEACLLWFENDKKYSMNVVKTEKISDTEEYIYIA